MTISSADCKKAICLVVNKPNGLSVLAQAYSGTTNIAQFLNDVRDILPSGGPATGADVIRLAGDEKQWKRIVIEKLDPQKTSWGTPPGSICRRVFDCRPFEDQLRATTYDDGNNVLLVEIEGE